MLSPDTILNPQPTGQLITLPFYPGYRYAAVPASSINNVVQVDTYPTRPASLIYHEHCYHLMDIKVWFSFIIIWNFILWLLFIDSQRFPAWQSTQSSNLWSENKGTNSSLVILILYWILLRINNWFWLFLICFYPFRVLNTSSLGLVLLMRSCLWAAWR